jgi:hypothetical protein
MHGNLKGRGVKRREVDIEKLALAYYLIARSIVDGRSADSHDGKPRSRPGTDRKAA